MLTFFKDCDVIELDPIYDKGKVGQMIIFGERVYWGKNLDPLKYPLSKYSCPSIFTIIEKQENYYILNDSNDNNIKVRNNFEARFLYDAQEWLNWNDKRELEEFSCDQRKLKQLESNIELLKDIIIKQRLQNITELQANELGLN